MAEGETSQKSIPDQKHIKILNETFKIESFKPEQWEMIKSIIYDRRDSFIVAGTGFGKSLIFQFPAVFLKKIVLVISPLISLMEDQVLSLKSKGINAHLLSPKPSERKVDLARFQIIYTTPEMFTCAKGTSKLTEIKERICMVAIDECHCITQWGLDFRKTFRELANIKTFLPGVPTVCLTATATDHCIRDVSSSLALDNPLIVRAELNRPNLEFQVIQKGKSFVGDVKKLLLSIESGTAIIYVLRRKDADNYSEELQREGFQSEPYHAGMKDKHRQEVLKSFANGTLRFIVATIAFGMGIDRSDVRAVIHYGSPKTLESYYQESGRAGRDGGPSKCIIFWEPRDFIFHRFWLNTKKTRVSSEYLQHCEHLIREMEKFLTSTDCRRLEILRYFIESTPELPVHEACCDNCTTKLHNLIPLHQMYKEIQKGGLLDLSDDIRILLSGVKAYKGQCNEKSFLELLMGKLPSSANRNHPLELFAKGKKKPEVWWSHILKIIKERKMVRRRRQVQVIPVVANDQDQNGAVEIRREDFLKLSEEGNKFLRRKLKHFRVKPTNEIFPLLTKTNQEFYIENSVIKNKPRLTQKDKVKAPEKKTNDKIDNLFKFEVPRVSKTSSMKLEKVNDGAGCSNWTKPDVKIANREAPIMKEEDRSVKKENTIMKEEDPAVKEDLNEEEIEEEDENLEAMKFTRNPLSVDLDEFLDFLQRYSEKAEAPLPSELESKQSSQSRIEVDVFVADMHRTDLIENSSLNRALKRHNNETDNDEESPTKLLILSTQ